MPHLDLKVAAALVALAVVITSCTRSYSAPPEVRVTPTVAVPAAPIVAPRCPPDGAGLAHGQGKPLAEGSQPTGFVATGVIRCAVTSERQRADGAEVSTIRQESGQSSAALLDALGLDDLRVSNPTSTNQPGVACPASYSFPFFLLLVDKAHRAYRPHIPVTPCGNPQQPVLDALTAMTWTSNGTFAVVWH